MADERRRFIVRVETVTSRGPTVPYCTSMFQLWDHSRLEIFQDVWLIPPSMRQCSDIPVGRNLCVRRDWELPWNAWLWIDDDHEWDSQVVYSLIEAMRRGAVDIISPLVGAKSNEHPGQPMVFKDYDEDLGLWNRWYTGWEKPDLYEVAAVGTGFELVRREVFEKMPEPWYERVRNPRRRNAIHGNDLYFCKKAKDLGFRVWLDTRVEVGHCNIKAYYPRRDYIESGLQRKELNENRSQRPIQVSTKPDVNTPKLWDEYYERGNWKWRESRIDVANRIAQHIPDGSLVMHFGCGEGWLTKQIADLCQDVKVVGYDQSAVAISLARKRGVECHLVDRLADYSANGQPAKFDYIIISDWLERIPDPFRLMNNLAGLLKPGAQMIVVVPALVLPPEDVPEHHHLFSEFNLGYFLDGFGRALEIEEFKERIFDERGEVIQQVPRYISRSTLEKLHGAQPVV